MNPAKAYQPSDHHNNFDLLRLTGALLVMFSHAYGQMAVPANEIMYRWTNHRYLLSTFGMMIFFTISGYLVTQSLLLNASVKKYIIRRVLRIYPAYIVNMLLLFFVLGTIFTTLPLKEYFTYPLSLKFLYENMLIIPSSRILPGVFNETDVNPSAWSVAFEVKLYLVLLILYIIRVIPFKWMISIAFGFGLIIKIFITPSLLQYLTNHDFKIWGSLGFYFITGSFLYAWKEKIPLHIVGIIILALAWWLTRRIGLPGELPELFFFAYTILWIGVKTPVLFTPKWDLSYGIYLYAAPVQLVLSLVSHHSLPLWQYNLVATPIIVLFAILSWNLVEKKALALKNKY